MSNANANCSTGLLFCSFYFSYKNKKNIVENAVWFVFFFKVYFHLFSCLYFRLLFLSAILCCMATNSYLCKSKCRIHPYSFNAILFRMGLKLKSMGHRLRFVFFFFVFIFFFSYCQKMLPFEVLSKAHTHTTKHICSHLLCYMKQHIRSIYCTNTKPNK